MIPFQINHIYTERDRERQTGRERQREMISSNFVSSFIRKILSEAVPLAKALTSEYAVS